MSLSDETLTPLCLRPSLALHLLQLLLELPDGKTELLKVCHTNIHAHSIAQRWEIR
jgi:hypothetical protein